MVKVKRFVYVILLSSICYFFLFSTLVGVTSLVSKNMLINLLIVSLFTGLIATIIYLMIKSNQGDKKMYTTTLKEIELKREYKNREFNVVIVYELLKTKQHNLAIYIYEIMDKKTGRSEKISQFEGSEYLQYPNLYGEKEYSTKDSIENIKHAIDSVIKQVVDSDIHKEEEIKMLEELKKEW